VTAEPARGRNRVMDSATHSRKDAPGAATKVVTKVK
jgi:hypothetical protein